MEPVVTEVSEEAARCFERAATLDPGHADAYYNLALAPQQAHTDEPARAVTAYEHALRLASGLPVRALDTGAPLPLRADSICVHGDKPSAVAQARGVRDALVAEGFTLGPLPEVVGR